MVFATQTYIIYLLCCGRNLRMWNVPPCLLRNSRVHRAREGHRLCTYTSGYHDGTLCHRSSACFRMLGEGSWSRSQWEGLPDTNANKKSEMARTSSWQQHRRNLSFNGELVHCAERHLYRNREAILGTDGERRVAATAVLRRSALCVRNWWRIGFGCNCGDPLSVSCYLRRERRLTLAQGDSETWFMAALSQVLALLYSCTRRSGCWGLSCIHRDGLARVLLVGRY